MKKTGNTLRIVKTILLILFFGALFASVDFGLHFFSSLIPEVNDGIPAPTLLMQFLFGDNGWTRARYFEVFRNAVFFTFALLTAHTVVGAVYKKYFKS